MSLTAIRTEIGGNYDELYCRKCDSFIIHFDDINILHTVESLSLLFQV